MTDTPNQSAAPAAAPAQSNSPFHQPIVPAPDGGDKSPVRVSATAAAPAARAEWDKIAATDQSPQAMRTRHLERQQAATNGMAPTAAPASGHQQQPRAVLPGETPLAPAADGSVEKVRVGDFEMTRDELAALVTDKAARDSIKLALPTPDAYKTELPATFQAPVGVSFEMNENDPAIKQVKEFAHRHSLPQEAVSELLGAYASLEVGKQQTFQTAFNAEVAKLGSTATARVTAVQTWLTAMAGPEAAALNAVLAYAPKADTIVAIENLMRKWSSQGGASFSQGGRENAPVGISDEQYNAMSFSEKKAYAGNASAGRR